MALKDRLSHQGKRESAFVEARPSVDSVHAVSRTVVYWKWEEEEDDGEGVGPVYVYTYGESADEPEREEEWDRWVRRSEALDYAQRNDYEFNPDE